MDNNAVTPGPIPSVATSPLSFSEIMDGFGMPVQSIEWADAVENFGLRLFIVLGIWIFKTEGFEGENSASLALLRNCGDRISIS